MMFTSKKRLAVAIAGVFSLGATAVQAVEFNATTTLQNTLAVTVVQDFDIGTVFATDTGLSSNGTLYDAGVGAFVVNPETGEATTPATVSADVSLTSISAPTPAQGSVDTIGTFYLSLPDTKEILASSFEDDTGTTLVNILDADIGVELAHESGNTAVPSLYMMHFTMHGVSDGTVTATGTGATANDGKYTIVPGFGVNTFIFNIGATVTTKPTLEQTDSELYQEGIYSGTFEVTANY